MVPPPLLRRQEVSPTRTPAATSNPGHYQKKRTHRFPETIILVDVAIFGNQFETMAQRHTAPDTLRQLRSLDVVHFACLAVLEDHTLATQAQPPIILAGRDTEVGGQEPEPPPHRPSPMSKI